MYTNSHTKRVVEYIDHVRNFKRHLWLLYEIRLFKNTYKI